MDGQAPKMGKSNVNAMRYPKGAIYVGANLWHKSTICGSVYGIRVTIMYLWAYKKPKNVPGAHKDTCGWVGEISDALHHTPLLPMFTSETLCAIWAGISSRSAAVCKQLSTSTQYSKNQCKIY